MNTLEAHSEIRSANMQLSPREEFEACDSFLRSYEQQVNNWPAVAQACIRVKDAELWKYGKFSSWADWIHKAAPFSARKIFYVVGLFKDLEADFTAEQLAAMPVETAKVARQLSPSVRRDPRVKTASASKRKAFVKVVKETHPTQHVEDEVTKILRFSESQWAVMEKALESYRAMNSPETSLETFLEDLASDWLSSQWEDSGYSNQERAQQLMAAQ